MSRQIANQYAVSYSICNPGDGLEKALERAVGKLTNSITDPDLVISFVAGVSPSEFDQHMPKLKEQLNAGIVVAANCEAAIVEQLELEGEASVVLWAAKFNPDVSILPMRLQYERSPDGGAFIGWPNEIDHQWPDDCFLISMNEPYSFPVDGLIERLNEDRAGVPIVGGVCSGSEGPGDNRIMLGDEVYRSGAIVLRVNGLRYRTIVSQGCRPIGDPYVVTKSFASEVMELGGKPAFKCLHDLFQTLPTRDQRLMQNGLQLGIVMNEQQAQFELGDFLIRSVVGVNETENSISIADFVRMGKTVQFHIRDEESATNELAALLASVDSAGGSDDANAENPWAKAALLFSCNGRGTRLFSEPNHDAMQFQKANANQLALAGLFAAGEIGPVGDTNFLHGFTVSAILLG
jgi:small ligand-binding sensory domain FIST